MKVLQLSNATTPLFSYIENGPTWSGRYLTSMSRWQCENTKLEKLNVSRRRSLPRNPRGQKRWDYGGSTFFRPRVCLCHKMFSDTSGDFMKKPVAV